MNRLFFIALVIFLGTTWFLTLVLVPKAKKIFKTASTHALWCFIFIGLLILEGLILYLLLGQAFRYSPEKIFQSNFTDPIPKDIRILEGRGESWQGFKEHLVFTGHPTTIETLLSGYPLLNNCTLLDPYTQKPKNIRNEVSGVFKEDISIIADPACYYKKQREDEFFVLWDKQKNKVYFYGRGD